MSEPDISMNWTINDHRCALDTGHGGPTDTFTDTIRRMTAVRTVFILATMTGLASGCLPGQGLREADSELNQIRAHQATQAMGSGDYQQAVVIFSEILAQDPDNVPAWIGTGDAYSELGDWNRAEPAFAQAAELEPQSYDAQFGHGVSLQMLERLVDAVAAYHRALVIDPYSAPACTGIATTYLQMGEAQHAVPFAERAVELDGADGSTWVNLGAALEQSGRDTEALEAYLAASERLDASPELMHNLLHAYARAGRHREVVGTARSILAMGPSAQAGERMGWAYFRLAEYDKSADAYRGAVDTDPAMWRAWNGLGVNSLNRWLLSERSDAEALREARTALHTSMQLNSDQPKVAALISQYQLH